ncbi:multidrug effflux MFS transporter [Secundilactobacillus similis DSM 23365 = JCM 2765]|uniref:Bcr/CflA family efflux transporter n=1 Tax=Secundilactobacillus similis DSM 23365 = JCM 2765 TaxID=1423804 RepID=A0A0R2FE31_9LACO|nr:multidrug effflux MFS transporter [Secundilactobacillus similis]KRN26815.1 major facilitator superfamily permease [Secundilactobacillus similis DSM 23365 = JCM 2765]
MKNVQKKVPSILIIIALVGFPQISESIFAPVLPALSRAFNVSAQTSQLTMSSYFIGFAVGVVFWGWLSDRIGRRQAMLWGIVVYLIGNLGLLFAGQFPLLMTARLLQAFGAAVGSVVTQTIMRESFSGVCGERVFAQVSAAMSLSPALGPLIGGALQTYWGGYHSVFFALVIMAMLLWGYTKLRLPETLTQVVTQTISWWQVAGRLVRTPRVWVYGVLISGINGVLFSYYAEAPFVFETHFGLSAVQYGWSGMVIAAASLVGASLATTLVGRVTPETLIDVGLRLALIGSVALFVGIQQLVSAFIAIFLAFTGINLALPMVLNRVLIGFEDVMGTASGLLSLGYYLGISALTLLMSTMHNGTVWVLPQYMTLVVAVMLIGSVGLHRVMAD